MLLIHDYFQQIQQVIAQTSFVQTVQVAYDSRSSYEGYIRGELYLLDDSTLHIREYVDVETTIERLSYAYHYVDVAGQFIFRYDNTDHHRRLNLATHPHHKHAGVEANVIASSAPDLVAVLAEIESLLHIS